MFGALGSWGFKPNLYDSCAMNKTVEIKQCTVFWHADDLKILHVSPEVVDGVLSHVTTKYGKVSSLSVSQGSVHDYIGIQLA